MTPEELASFRDLQQEEYGRLAQAVDQIPPASSDIESQDHSTDALAEAIFLRAFTLHESHIESLFFHYVTGGLTGGGRPVRSRLQPCDVGVARTIVKGGYKFLTWAKPENVRDVASVYIDGGWPIVDVLAFRAQELADCERIRNRIAHRSFEALQQFNIVQRNLFGTERLFALSPGQLLRARHNRHRSTVLGRYLAVMRDLAEALIDPPE